MAATGDRHRHPVAVRLSIRRPEAEHRPRRTVRFLPIIQQLGLDVKLASAKDEGRVFAAMYNIRNVHVGFDFKDFGLTDKEEYPNAMLIRDETSSIIVPEIISVHVGFDFKDFGLTDKEEYPNAMLIRDETGSIIVPEIISVHVGFDFEDFGLTYKEEYPNAMLIRDETGSIIVPEIIRIRPSGNEHWRESMLALGTVFEASSTPTAESSSVDCVVNNNDLFLDSAAGHHMVSHAALLSNLRDPPAGMDRVRTADGSLLPVVGYGDIQMEGFHIGEVCLVPGLEVNLISVGQLASSHNICSCFFGDQCNLMLADGSLIGGAFRRNDNQYILRFLEIP